MILGIDTSNYTTSVCVADEGGKAVFDIRRMLTVKDGERGLRQSEAFYQHVNHLPEMFAAVKNCSFTAVCVSAAPRRVEGSYMPCFKAGMAFASVIADMLKLPLIKTTHQEGHIKAAVFDKPEIDQTQFICVHLSGGTTEILLCSKDKEGYASNIIGKTIDISAGQFIDRVGVRLGLSFPCGKEMDELCSTDHSVRFPVSVQGSDMSFSGVESQSIRLQQQGCGQAELIGGVFDCVGNTIQTAVANAANQHKVKDIVYCGGVSGSRHIRKILQAASGCERIGFAADGLGNDNAVGVALIGLDALKGKTDGQ